MATPSVTLRSLQNHNTGIDICVPSIREEEAPLGGTSILYEISVCTTLAIFKTKLHKTEDVVYFSIFKAYREIEDFYNKIKKKVPQANLPTICSTASKKEISPDKKLSQLDALMKAIAQNDDICKCSVFTQFIGVHHQKQSSIVSSKVEDIENTPLTNKTGTTVENIEEGQVFLDFGKKSDNNKGVDNISDLFPKMKATEGKTKNNVQSEQANKSRISESKKIGVKNMDLFEEVKIVKEIEKAGIATKKTTSQGLFDDFDDENLFSSKPSKPKGDKVHSVKMPVKTKEIVSQNIKKEVKKPPIVEIGNDSEIIIKDRKIGEISLFQEQDLGDHVLKEEEPLFLVSSSKKETKRNDLLFSDDNSPDEVKEILDDNLDDLLNFEPLPLDTLESEHKKPPAKPIKSEKEEPKEAAPKPIPRPRKKSIETPEQAKPEVLPRKIFLDNPPPPVASKPVLPPKPSKPKPPAKKPSLTAQKAHNASQQTTKKLEDSNVNASNEKPKISNNQNTLPGLADDLEKLDILKYIEQEEQSASAETSLFD